MARILLLHGPNLSQLGRRDPGTYGTATLADVEAAARQAADAAGHELVHEQHEAEAELVRRVHAAVSDGTDAVIVNAGALTHYSYALRDALELLAVPLVEVHLSNIHAREGFRHTSVTAAVADAIVAGLGLDGYPLAVGAVDALLSRP